jgi:hypothetical protein
MRNRLCAFLNNNLGRSGHPYSDIRDLIVEQIKERQGCEEPPARSGYAVAEFFQTTDLRDVLDGIRHTLQMLRTIRQSSLTPLAAECRTHVARVFQEENMAYTLGDDGIVHPFVDSEFEQNRSATLLALNDKRFGEARTDFEQAFRHLRNGEGKQGSPHDVSSSRNSREGPAPGGACPSNAERG